MEQKLYVRNVFEDGKLEMSELICPECFHVRQLFGVFDDEKHPFAEVYTQEMVETMIKGDCQSTLHDTHGTCLCCKKEVDLPLAFDTFKLLFEVVRDHGYEALTDIELFATGLQFCGYDCYEQYFSEHFGEPNSRRWVNAYEVSRAFGGPEEGGWYYDYGHPLQSIEVTGKTDDEVTEIREQLRTQLKAHEDVMPYLDRLEVYTEDHKGRPFPLVTPHYE